MLHICNDLNRLLEDRRDEYEWNWKVCFLHTWVEGGLENGKNIYASCFKVQCSVRGITAGTLRTDSRYRMERGECDTGWHKNHLKTDYGNVGYVVIFLHLVVFSRLSYGL